MENGDLATQNGDVRQQTDQTVTNILNIWMPSNFYHHGWPLSSPLAGSPPMAMAASFWLLGYGYANAAWSISIPGWYWYHCPHTNHARLIDVMLHSLSEQVKTEIILHISCWYMYIYIYSFTSIVESNKINTKPYWNVHPSFLTGLQPI